MGDLFLKASRDEEISKFDAFWENTRSCKSFEVKYEIEKT